MIDAIYNFSIALYMPTFVGEENIERNTMPDDLYKFVETIEEKIVRLSI